MTPGFARLGQRLNHPHSPCCVPHRPQRERRSAFQTPPVPVQGAVSYAPSPARSARGLPVLTKARNRSVCFRLRETGEKSCRVAYRSALPAHGKCTRGNADSPAHLRRFPNFPVLPSFYGHLRRLRHSPRWSGKIHAPSNAGFQVRSILLGRSSYSPLSTSSPVESEAA